MLNDILKVFEVDNKYLVLNPLVPAWVVTNKNGVIIINLFDQLQSKEKVAENYCGYDKTSHSDDVIKFLNRTEEAGLFIQNQTEKQHKPYSLAGIYLNMTSACNLHCIYCFAATRVEYGQNNLLLDDYYRILNEAKQISQYLDINFTGGEPLLSPNTLPVARYAKKLGFRTRILTNATLINSDNVDEVASCFDVFKISVDGSTREKHEYYRGVNTYERTLNAIDLLLKRNKEVNVAMVVTRNNKDDVSNMSKKWGSKLIFQPLFPLGKAKSSDDVALTGQEYFDVLSNDANINPYSNLINILKAHQESRTIKKCAIGDGEISISCTGDVYPCQLLHHEEFLLGNVKDSSLIEIYNSDKNDLFKHHTVENISKCKECDFKYLCGGACQARHFSETGSIDEAGDFCQYEQKAIINGLIRNCELTKLG